MHAKHEIEYTHGVNARTFKLNFTKQQKQDGGK